MPVPVDRDELRRLVEHEHAQVGGVLPEPESSGLASTAGSIFPSETSPRSWLVDGSKHTATSGCTTMWLQGRLARLKPARPGRRCR